MAKINRRLVADVLSIVRMLCGFTLIAVAILAAKNGWSATNDIVKWEFALIACATFTFLVQERDVGGDESSEYLALMADVLFLVLALMAYGLGRQPWAGVGTVAFVVYTLSFATAFMGVQWHNKIIYQIGQIVVQASIVTATVIPPWQAWSIYGWEMTLIMVALSALYGTITGWRHWTEFLLLHQTE